MDIAVIFILALLVAVIAFVAGRYIRYRTGETPEPPEQPKKVPAVNKLPARLSAPIASGDREVQVVVGWLLSQAFEQTGVKVADDKVAYQRIVEAAEKAVKALKTETTTTISLPFLTADASGPKHFETQLTREVIQELARY